MRQGFIPIFDMPVEIAEIDRPLGTHLYTAMQMTDNGTKMRWNVLTMAFTVPPGTPACQQDEGRPTNKNKKNAKEAPKPAAQGGR